VDLDSIRTGAQKFIDGAAVSFEPGLSGATAGTPLLVEKIQGGPYYWMVPAERGSQLVGAVRVSLAGELLSVGRLDKARWGDVVTGITAAEAATIAAPLIDGASGETAAEPRFVADGPPGREVWLVEVFAPDERVRQLFITRGGTYNRTQRPRPDKGHETLRNGEGPSGPDGADPAATPP
jgi:hypothetical protein